MRRIGSTVVLLLVLFASVVPASAVTITWGAGSGLLPDQLVPPWMLIDSSPGFDPVLAGGVLTLATGSDGENMGYSYQLPVVDTSGPFFVEFDARFVSGTSSHVARAPMVVILVVGPSEGILFFMGLDVIFDNSANVTRGTTVLVDTNDAFHTYRIEVDGAGGYDVFYDGGLSLSGATYISASDFGGSPEQISWGELSILATGTSEWTRFVTSAVVPLPAAVWLFGGALVGLFGITTRRKITR